MSANVMAAYREYLSGSGKELEDRIIEAELSFFKVMRNLVFGTNRSIFLTTAGKDQEGVEQWLPGKPINRINIRATIANFKMENVAESIYINTFRDDRELSLWMLVDVSDSMYPDTLIAGAEDPLTTRAAHAIYLQALIRSLARNYDTSLKLVHFPRRDYMPRSIDVKGFGLRDIGASIEVGPEGPGTPEKVIEFLETKRVKHSVVVIISHERLFEFPGKEALLERLKSFVMTNDVIYFPLVPDYAAILGNSATGVEVNVHGKALWAGKADERLAAAGLIDEALNETFATLETHGLHVCPVRCGKADWVGAVVDFFRNRLVLR